MKKTQDISQVLQQLRVPVSSQLDERVYAEIAKAAPSAPATSSGPQVTPGQILTLLLKKKSALYTLATALGLVLVAALALNHSTSSAWAMEQAIEALKKYKGLHITGYIVTGGKTVPLDAWARADATGNRVEGGLAKSGDITVWTSDNKTYVYDRIHNTVFVEPGINFGLNPWLGPKLLAVIAKMKDYKAFEGEDPATGQKRVIVTCSIENLSGPQSFLLEFDIRTKLLVSMKSWRNLRREGAPNCDFENILYFEDLPDSAFNFEPPAGTQFADMPLTIPEASLSSLSDPKCGISTEGMTREQACQKILEELWAARSNNDLARIRQLCPLTATWSDELLRDPDVQDEKAQVLKIGGIERTGRSKLGPVMLVPSWIRRRDGGVEKLWMIIQFRETDQGTSCVIYGPHGYALNAKE